MARSANLSKTRSIRRLAGHAQYQLGSETTSHTMEGRSSDPRVHCSSCTEDADILASGGYAPGNCTRGQAERRGGDEVGLWVNSFTTAALFAAFIN